MKPRARQLWVLLALTLVRGLNRPVMKAGVSGLPGAPLAYPPLTFRTLSTWLGLPVRRLGEQPHWEGFAAVASMVAAISLVLIRR